MNEKEIIKAIDTLKIAQAEIEWEYPIDYACAFDVIFKASERLIPKKPIEEDKIKLCPNCGTIVIYHPHITYCDKCGQAINIEQNK